MTQNSVSKNFIACLQELKSEKHIKSDREFAKSLDFLPQNLSQIVNGKRDVTVELIKKAHSVYGFNLSYLFAGTGNRIERKNDKIPKGQSVSSIPYINEISESKYLQALNSSLDPVQELEGWYYEGSYDVDDARIFAANENDLQPFIKSGDKLVAKRIPRSRWGRFIRDYFIYILVEKERIGIYRLLNFISTNNSLQKVGELNHESHGDVVNADEVIEIWEITHVISRWGSNQNYHNKMITEKLMDFQNAVEHNGEAIKEMNSTLSKLLRQNRDQQKFI